MKQLIKITLPLLLLTSCMSEGRFAEYDEGVTKQYVVTSAPSFCYHSLINEPFACPKFATANDNLVSYGGIACYSSDINYSFEWGVSYEITVKEKTRIGAQVGDCPQMRTIVSVNNKTPDPIGTRYIHNIGSTWGGLTLTRLAPGSEWFQLEGYSKPIYCDDSLCGHAEAGVEYTFGVLLQPYPAFELVEIEGKREIALKPR